MLKQAFEEQIEEEQQSFRRVRDRAVVSIRKEKRDHIFNQRRYRQKLEYQEALSDDEKDKQQSIEQQIIVDSALETQIHELMQKTKSVQEIDIPRLIDCLQSEEVVGILEGAIGIRRILKKNVPPTMAMIELGVHRILIEKTSHISPQVRMECWWALANIATGDSGECDSLAERGVIESFLRCLQEENAYVVEQGAWGIGNLACDSNALRNRIIKQGGISLLAQAVHRYDNPRLATIVSGSVANLCRGKPQYRLIQEGIILLCCLLASDCVTDEDYLLDMLNVIGNHCKGSKRTSNQMKALLETEFLLNVIAFTTHCNPEMVTAALRVIGHMLLGSTETVNFMLKLNILEYLERCLDSKSLDVRFSACWALTNIACNGEQQANFIFDRPSLLTSLVELMAIDEEEVKNEIVAIFTYISEYSNKREVEEFLVEAEMVSTLVELMKSTHKPYIICALQNLYNILFHAQQREKLDLILQEFERNNGYVLLKSYQYSESQAIVYESCKIISMFIDLEKLQNVAV